jgi:hypothetical protein
MRRNGSVTVGTISDLRELPLMMARLGTRQ